MWIHWLTPGNYNAPNEILFSNLASVRMRIGLVAKYASNSDLIFSAGDIIPVGADVIVIGKIGSDCKSGREKLWLNQIFEATKLSKTIILDYTDNHLGDKFSPMHNFYKNILKFCNKAVVPSLVMQRMLTNFFENNIFIIEDPIEVKPIVPRKPIINDVVTLLWFGHGSNIAYLLDYLKNDSICDIDLNLVVLSNKYGLDMMRGYKTTANKKINFHLENWSLQTMINASNYCQGCIIPSGIDTVSKSGASSNRLITAFALGLPVSADMLGSHIPFEKYFHNIKESPISEFINKINYYHECVKSAQKDVVPLFDDDLIFKKWYELFASK